MNYNFSIVDYQKSEDENKAIQKLAEHRDIKLMVKEIGEEYGIDIQSAKFIVTNNCILVSKLNPWTSRVICGNRESNQICSTEFVVWNPASMKTKGFLFMLAKSAKFIEYCTQGATGTSHSHRRINPELMMKFDFSYNSEIAIKFYGIATMALITCVIGSPYSKSANKSPTHS